MAKPILFSLQHCLKCEQTKELLGSRSDVDVVTFPHELSAWTAEDMQLATTHDVLEDLKATAPILWQDGKKTVGYLRIRRWLQENQP